MAINYLMGPAAPVRTGRLRGCRAGREGDLCRNPPSAGHRAPWHANQGLHSKMQMRYFEDFFIYDLITLKRLGVLILWLAHLLFLY